MKIATLLLIILFFASGCSLQPWPVYRAYKGPERSLDEVAVLLLRYPYDQQCPVPIEIDGSNVEYSGKCPLEYHLLPGTHSIEAIYSTSPRYSSSSLTKESTFLAGQVYRLNPQANMHFLSTHEQKERGLRSPHDMMRGDWYFTIKHIGPVESVAKTHILPIIQKKIFFIGYPNRIPPEHWNKYIDPTSSSWFYDKINSKSRIEVNNFLYKTQNCVCIHKWMLW